MLKFLLLVFLMESCYACLIGTSLSELVDFKAFGSGAEIVRTPSLDRDELTDSGFTPLGRVKL